MNKSNTFDICIIVHGCPMNAESVLPKSKKWMNWLEGALVEKGYHAVAPEMSVAWKPTYENWKKEIEKYPITEHSILVGHSCGCAFLVQWLLATGKKVRKLVLVAPAKIPESPNDARMELYNFDLPADGSAIASETVIFTSSDLERHVKSAQMYKDSLHARVVELPKKGHFLIFTMGTTEFPELLEELVSTK